MNAKNIRQLDMEIDLTRSIQLLAKTYEELAVMQMQRIRKSVENTRRFTDELNKVYGEVKFAYRRQVLSMSENKDTGSDTFIFSTMNKNGKTLALLIAPDQRFTGSIAQKVFYPFYEYVSSKNCDIAIIGKVGKEMFEQKVTDRPFVYISIPSNNDYESLKVIFDYMLKYEFVEVFHGKFVNLINQIAVKLNLTGDEVQAADYQAGNPEEYLFEPSVEKILNFFEEQIFGTFFKQVLSEAGLARLGSRISAMETATTNAGVRVKALNKGRKAFLRSVDNKKQLQRISGISIWG